MKFLAPITLTDAMLISSNVAETDYTAWNAATAYTLAQRCIRTTATTHKIYERVVAGTTATAPEADTTNWIEVSPTNRWKMFDASVGTVTTNATSIVVTLAPGTVIDSLGLLDLVASSVRVQMTDGAAGPTVYDKTFAIYDTAPVDDWWEYFFSPIRRSTVQLVEDLPPYPNGRITVTISEPATAGCGTLAAGRMVNIGLSLSGVGLGILDYSRKETDTFGATKVLARSYAKRFDVPVFIEDNTDLDTIAQELAAVRAIPCVWIASDRWNSLVAYGFYKDWSITIPYADRSEARISIEGLT